MPPGSILDLAQQVIRESIVPGAMVLDATVGNGHDTLFLAALVGKEGLVLGLDVQEAALAATRARLAAADLLKRVHLVLDDHRHVGRLLDPLRGRPFLAAMYNLGYLPGSDKKVVTQADSTIASLDAVSTRLSPGGVVTVVAYRGHRGGVEESRAVLQWCEQLHAGAFKVVGHQLEGRSDTAPHLITIKKRQTIAADSCV